MSYLDQLNSFTGDLNLQHEQMTASLSNLAENLQNQFDDEFNKTIEQMELAGGAVSTAGLGLSGVHKSFKGFKKWKDARAEKLSKAQEEFERSGRATRGGERIDPDLRITESEAREITGGGTSPITPSKEESLEDLKARVAENNRVGAVETNQKFVNEGEGVSQGAEPLPTTGAEAEEGAVNQFLSGVEEGGRSVAEDMRTTQGTAPDLPPSVSSADQTIGGSTELSGYNYESEGIFDNPIHSGRYRGAGSLEEALGDTDFTPKAPEPQFIRETRTTLQLLPEENTRIRSGTLNADLVGDEDNVRLGASRNSNVREIETSFDRPNPKYRAPTLEGEGRLQPTTYTDSTIQDSATHIISDPATNKLADQTPIPREDLNRQPFNTLGGKGAEGRGVDTSIQRQVGETGDYKGGTTAEAEPEPTRGLPKSGGEPVVEPQGITQNIGEIPPDRLPLDSRGLGTNVGEVSAGGEEGVGVGRTVATGAEVGAETGAEVGAEVGSGLLGEIGAMGATELALGSLGPVAEVVGAGFMIAGLVHDLQDKPEEVAKTIAGGVSGKIGIDPSSIGGGGSANVGTI